MAVPTETEKFALVTGLTFCLLITSLNFVCCSTLVVEPAVPARPLVWVCVWLPVWPLVPGDAFGLAGFALPRVFDGDWPLVARSFFCPDDLDLAPLAF